MESTLLPTFCSMSLILGRLKKKKIYQLGLLAEPQLTPPPPPNLGPVIR